MPQSLSRVLVHLIFSTKHRVPALSLEVRPELHAYIRNQETHHQKVTFQEEYRRFLERYQVAYDERYVWD